MTTAPEPPFKDFSATTSGAKFYRADLHIHSYGGSADVSDSTMTPEAILAAAVDRGIDMVALADHNELTNVGPLLSAAARMDGKVVAIPGVEITTSHGHVLVYAPVDQLDRLDTWLKGTKFELDEAGEKYTRKRIDEIAKEIREFDGLAIPAHIGRTNTGFMTKAPHRECQAVFESADVIAVELDPNHLQWFTGADTDDGHDMRHEYLTKRRDALAEASPRVARVVFSDAHSLDRVGRNPTGEERLTRVKMEKPSYEGFRTALLDPDARVVLEGTIPEIYPRIVGVRYIGGFLDGQEIGLAPNLTALIGGRGAGKSTAIEALRWACTGSPSAISKSEAWPSSVQVEFLDAMGVRHFAQRDAGTDATFEIVDGEAVPVVVPLEGYPQDRVAEIVRGSEGNPGLLLTFLDQYLEVGGDKSNLESLRGQLEANADLLIPLVDAPVELQAAKKRLQAVQGQIKTAAASKAHEALAYRRMLVGERGLRESLAARLDELKVEIERLEITPELETVALEAGISDISKTSAPDLVVGKAGSDDDNLKSLLAALGSALQEWQGQGLKALQSYRERIDVILGAWEERDKRVEARIQAIVEKLRAEGVPTDLKALNALAAEEAAAQKAVTSHAKRDEERKELIRDRGKLLTAYRSAQDRRTALRSQLGKRLSEQFRDAGVEFQVGIKFRSGELVESYERWLRDRIGNRFLRGERVGQLCQRLHPIDLAADLQKADVARILGLRDSKGSPFFSKAAEAQEFIGVLRADPVKVFELETLCRSDRPEVTLTVDQDDKKIVVPFHKLSFGQKASILLGVLLFSDRPDPLVIDQPEDHLDSAFIYESVVKTLRKVKERRQVIVATHNANIAVLGDAELIVPLRSWGGQGLISDRGSVDTATTRERACKILEGGEQAYRRRGEMYGL